MQLEWAIPGHLDELIEVGQKSHAEARVATLPLDEDRLRRSFKRVLEDDRGVYFFVIARSTDGACAGVLFATVNRPFFTSALLAHAYWFYVAPEYRGSGAAGKLIAAFRRWAEKRGAAELQINQTSGVDLERVDAKLRRSGFDFLGGNYSMALDSD